MFVGRASEAHGQEIGKQNTSEGSMWMGLILGALRCADALCWSGPAPWLVGAGQPQAVLHGVINLLTQGSARTLWRVTRCLAFCRPTNPLTRPEHALLTPRSQTLLTVVAHGPLRGPGHWGGRSPRRPCPWPGICVQTRILGQGMQTGLANSATCCWVTSSKPPGLSEPVSSAADLYLTGCSEDSPD